MGKYKIKISYQTGDSFRNEDCEDYLDLEWTNLDVAKENLQAIKEHYINVYQESQTQYSKKYYADVYKENENNFWFVESKNRDSHFTTSCIKLKTDDGKLMQMGCFWCGYFETLYGAEIEVEEDDMKFKI